MKHSLSSLALIQHYYEEGKDIFQAFAPLVIYILARQNKNEITVEEIYDLFCNEYGINIPTYPLETILNRLRPEFIRRQSGKIHINRTAVDKASSGIQLNKERKNFGILLNDFVDYCKNFVQPINITLEEADELFSDFLRSHDSELLFALSNGECISLLDCDSPSKNSDMVFLLNHYINHQLSENTIYSEFIVHAALGHLFSSTILYRDFLHIRGNAVCKNCYLDANILFDIFGLNGPFRKKTSRQFITELQKLGTNIKVFNHNFYEFLEILENCTIYIDSEDYKAYKASRAMYFFRNNDYTKEGIQVFIAKIPTELAVLGIVLVEKPNPNKYQDFQIDREELKQCILDFYNSKAPQPIEESEIIQTIEIDIDSIESIYKLRGNNVPTSIGNTSDVLLTANSSLAHASMLFQKKERNLQIFSIPTVITDVFLGTMIWIQAPSELAENYSRSKMIMYTNAVLQPSPKLIEKLSQQIEKAKVNLEQPLSEENARILLETDFARLTLADSTLNDDERITSETPYDLIRAMEKEFTSEPLKKIKELTEIVEHKQEEVIRAENEAENHRQRVERQKVNLEDKIQKLSRTIRRTIIAVSYITIATLFILQRIGVLSRFANEILEWILFVGGLGIFSVIGFSKKIGQVLEKKLRSILEVDS